MVAVITMPAVPIIRPVIAIVRIRPVIAVRVIVAIWVIPIVPRTDPDSDCDASVRALRWNESQYSSHQSD